MRPLTEDEMRIVFEKLHKFIGKNIKSLVERTDEPHCLRLQKNKVFYVREDMMKRATNVRILIYKSFLKTQPPAAFICSCLFSYQLYNNVF